MAAQRRIALVTGANRGIGREVARQLARQGYTVLLTARDLGKAEQAAAALRQAGHDLLAQQLDVADAASVARAHERIARDFGHLDVLINNAAIDYDRDQHVLTADLDRVRRVFETNTLGVWRTTQALLPLLRQGTSARIVNVSSEAGALGSLTGGTPAYSLSKAALNALTQMLAAALDGSGVLVNAVCPGWVRTDMGGTSAPRSVEQGAASVLWAATLPDEGPTGGFFRDGKRLDW